MKRRVNVKQVNLNDFEEVTRTLLIAYGIPDNQNYKPNVAVCRNAKIDDDSWLRYFLVMRDFLKNWGAMEKLQDIVNKLLSENFEPLESMDIDANIEKIKLVMDGFLDVKGICHKAR
ncbi:MAG: hypothetical protein ACTSXP_00060 [Promethearchaeota archaeon]